MLRSKKKIAFVLIILIFSLSGCLLFRFLEFRDQLKDFEKNFEIDDKDGLELIFKDPVLKGSDMVWLMRTEPSIKKSKEEWTYNFIKRYKGRKNEKGDFNIPVKMKYENNLLKSMAFPERFLKYFSKELFAKFMESMGETQVKKLSKSSKTEVQNLTKESIPDAGQIEDMIGVPFSREDFESHYSYTYRYIYRNTKDKSKFYGLRFILQFDKKTNRMKELIANIRGINMTIDFSDVL